MSTSSTAKKQPQKGNVSAPKAKDTTKQSGKNTKAATANKNGANKNGANKQSASPGKQPAKKTTAKQTKAPVQEYYIMDDPVAREVILILIAVLAVVLFLCNFGIIGPVGNAVSKVMFGMFGWMAYLAPVYAAVLIFFKVSNRENEIAMFKVLAAVLLFFLLGMTAEIIGGASSQLQYYSIAEIFTFSSGKHGGGVIAGSMAYALCKVIGRIGCVIVIIALALICIVVITERSLIKMMKDGGTKTYEFARVEADKAKVRSIERKRIAQERKQQELDEMILRKQEKMEEEQMWEQERILRMDRKADGVSIQNLDFPQDDKEETSEKEVRLICDDMHEITLEDIDGLPREHIFAKPVTQEKEAEETPESEAYLQEITFSQEAYDQEMDQMQFKMDQEKDREIEDAGMQEERFLDGYEGQDYYYENNGQAEDSYDIDAYDPYASRERTADFIEADTDFADAAEGGLQDGDETDSEAAYAETVYAEDMPEKSKDFSIEEEHEDLYPSDVETMPIYGKAQTVRSDSPYEILTQNDRKIARESGLAADASTHSNQKPGISGRERPQAVLWKNPNESVPDQTQKEFEKQAKQPPVKKYIFPPMNLLKLNQNAGAKNNQNKLKETARRLQETLASFGVRVNITHISQGPAVTRYEMQLEQGVNVKKISNLQDNIKMNLEATEIRIEAPIPGKNAVGIEVPNEEVSPVYFRELIDNQEFKEFGSKVVFAVGKDIAGKVILSDIAKMPHLLIAGSTGSGKSVCINTIIMSILYKADPNDVKMIMIDPKKVELKVYDGIPHLMAPVVTDCKKAAGTLQWGVAEMDNRYQKFADMNVRDLKGYNAKIRKLMQEGKAEGLTVLPQIVIIVDELADLMMVASNEVEESICRLAQLARAAGIHLIIATQRPSVDVITGLIKANMPSRIAFKVSSGVDSRTILDTVGAEKLLGKGDMLFYPSGIPKPIRVQGAFISDDEVSDVVDFIKNQVIGNVYDDAVIEKIESMKIGNASTSATTSESPYDDYFIEAGRFIIEKEKASIGMLQRVFKVGFNRAARIMDQLCDAGVVGPEEGTKPRKILMSESEFENYIEEYL